jgi:hypothetical protein
MEYDNTAQALDLRSHGVAGSQLAEPRPPGLPTIHGQLESCLERASILGHRAHEIANHVLGSRPEVAGAGNAARNVSPSITQLVDDIAAAISHIESGLNRL